MTQLISVTLFSIMLAVGPVASAASSEKAKKTQKADKGSAESSSVYFITPKNNDTVQGEFTVKFGLKGKMTIHPAGELVEGSGHHHLIIDGGPVPEGQVVNKSDHELHFGKGETETKLTLSPGKHTLTMQFADGAHRSYGEKMSSTISINVKDPAAH